MLAEGEQGNLVCLYGAGWSLHQALEHFICSVNTRIQVSPNPTHKHLSSQLHSTHLVKPDGSKSLTKDRQAQLSSRQVSEEVHMHLDFTNTQVGMEAPILYFTKEKTPLMMVYQSSNH